MKMRTKPTNSKATKMVKDIRRATRKNYGAEEKIRIVLEGLRGEHTPTRSVHGRSRRLRVLMKLLTIRSLAAPAMWMVRSKNFTRR